MLFSAGFCSWVRLVIGITHALCREMRVHLRRGQGSMAEQFLNGSKIGAIVKQVGRKGVPQRVWADAGIKSSLFQILADFASDAARRDAPTMTIDVQRFFRMQFMAVLSSHLKPCCERTQRMGAKWHDAFTSAFAADKEGLTRFVYILHINAHQFADTNTR